MASEGLDESLTLPQMTVRSYYRDSCAVYMALLVGKWFFPFPPVENFANKRGHDANGSSITFALSGPWILIASNFQGKEKCLAMMDLQPEWLQSHNQVLNENDSPLQTSRSDYSKKGPLRLQNRSLSKQSSI